MDRVVDFHNHVLHGIDDGPANLETAVDMVVYASSVGITDIINTTHYNHPRIDTGNVSKELLESKVQEIQSSLPEGLDINIHISSEVYFSHDLHDKLSDSLVAYKDRYVLIEFPVINFPKGYQDVLFNILLSGYIPIIAHPERYRAIQSNIKYIDKLVSMGCVIQIDAGSIIGSFGGICKDTALNLLSRGQCHVIGSDAHNNGKRNFCMMDAINLISDSDRLLSDVLMQNSINILEANDIEKDVPPLDLESKGLLSKIKRYIGKKN